MRISFSWLFIAMVIIVPIGAFGIVQWTEKRFADLPVLGPEGHRAQPYALYNIDGKLTGQEKWNGKFVVAHYFFTHCPVVCPKMIRNLKRIQAATTDLPVQIVSFTVDPERDSVEHLARYAAKMNITGNWDLLTGDKKELYRLARKSFLLVATDGDGGPDDFIHSDRLVLIDKEQRIRGFYDGTDADAADKLIEDVKRLKRRER